MSAASGWRGSPVAGSRSRLRPGVPLAVTLGLGVCVDAAIIAVALPRLGSGPALALAAAALALLLLACLALCRPYERSQDQWKEIVARAATQYREDKN